MRIIGTDMRPSLYCLIHFYKREKMSGRKCVSLIRNMRFSRMSVPMMRNLAVPAQNAAKFNTVHSQQFVIRSFSSEPRNVQEEIGQLVKKEKVVIFMKGVPDAPRCGFSNAVVQIMRMHGVEYESHDVLSDEGIREGIKEFSNWPTIPQVYMEGELVEELQKVGITSALLGEEEGEKK